MTTYVARFWAVMAYLASIVAANWLTAHYGLVPMGFGLMATAGTFTAGIAFVARDTVQDAAGRVAALGVLVVGCGLSWFLATPTLAVASAIAFGLSELVDMAIYTPLRRSGYIKAAVASNLWGAIVDTFVFLALAGFAITGAVVAGQLLGKAWATVAVVLLVGVGRAVLRQRLDRAGT